MVRSKQTLFHALFWITLFFTVLPPAAIAISGFHVAYSKIVYLIGILGVSHVGMTAFFFVGDRRYKEIIRSEPQRYILAPIALTLFAFVVFTYWPKGFWPYFAVHYAWLLWHFGRQNFGIYAFLSASNRSGAVSVLERNYFSLLPIAAIPKALVLYPQIGLTPAAARVAEFSSFALTAACFVIAVIIALRVRHDRQRVIAICMGLLFFLPTIASSNPLVATAFYAHPVQYIVMMAYLAGDKKQGPVGYRLGVLTAAGLGLWVALTYLSGSYGLAFLALTYGLTQAHFVVDAGLWKMKQPKQRAAILDSYDFLFSNPSYSQSGMDSRSN
jgi:hypothetical protein